MLKVEWEEPPGALRGGKHREFVNALKDNPSTWAVFKRGAKNSGTNNVTSGTGSWKPKGAFEAVSRINLGGGYDTYVRYVGEAETGQDELVPS